MPARREPEKKIKRRRDSRGPYILYFNREMLTFIVIGFMKKTVVSLFVVLFFASAALSQDYYVDCMSIPDFYPNQPIKKSNAGEFFVTSNTRLFKRNTIGEPLWEVNMV
jgi:hypothetical protein